MVCNLFLFSLGIKNDFFVFKLLCKRRIRDRDCMWFIKLKMFIVWFFVGRVCRFLVWKIYSIIYLMMVNGFFRILKTFFVYVDLLFLWGLDFEI